MSSRAKATDRKQVSGYQGLEMGQEWEQLDGYEFPFGAMKMFRD